MMQNSDLYKQIKTVDEEIESLQTEILSLRVQRDGILRAHARKKVIPDSIRKINGKLELLENARAVCVLSQCFDPMEC